MTELVDARPPVDRGSVFANAPMGVALCTPDGDVTDHHITRLHLPD